jgi:hypothetical protein
MNWLKWQKGRQGGGYEKLMLISNPYLFRFDCYLLRFPHGTEIKPHRDPVKGRNHYRLNIILRRANLGGALCFHAVSGRRMFQFGRVSFFRPDEVTHSMTKTYGKTQYVLSFGWSI